MSREEVEKLLGGYATGTLTPDEQQALFAAALDDQELFDALAREQSLRDLLRDPAAKAEVLAALDDAPVPWWRMPLSKALWFRPAVAAAAVALIAVTAVVWTRKQATAPQTATIAELRESVKPVDKFSELPPATAPKPTPEMDRPVTARRQTVPPAPELAKDKQNAAPSAPPPPVMPSAAAAPPPAIREEALKAEKPTAAPALDEAIARLAPQRPQTQAQFAPPVSQQGQQQGQTGGVAGFRDSMGMASGGGGGRDFSRLIAPDARGLFYGNPGTGGALTGRITDPTNAAITGAKVTAVQPGTDVKFETTTDSNGDYNIPFLPQANYQISAEARGFKRVNSERAVDAETKSQRLDIQLDVGATAETVEVTAVTPSLDTANTSSGLRSIPLSELDRKSAKKVAPPRTALASARATPLAVNRLGVRCSIIRESAGAEPAEVDIGTPLRVGESVKLKLVPNDHGYLRVWERVAGGALRAIANGLAQPMRVFETRLPVFSSAGSRQLYVQFSRNALGDAGSVFPTLAQQAAGNIVQNVSEGTANATYVVNPSGVPSPQELIVPITLTYR